MTLSPLPRLSVINDDDDDVAGAILYALFNLPLHNTSLLPPPHHAANESRTDMDFREIPGSTMTGRPLADQITISL